MSSRFRWLRDPRLPGAQLLLVAGVAEREHRLGVLDLLEAVERRRADPLGRRVGRAQLGVARPRSRAARRAARRRRRRRSPVRRGRSRGGCGAPSSRAQLRRPLRVGGARSRRRSAGRQHLLEAPAAQPLQAAVVGEVEVDRGDRDPPAGDRVEVGPLDLLVAGLPAVDLVAGGGRPTSSPTSFSSSL